MERLDDNAVPLEHLRESIGFKVRHQGSHWEIIEILEDGPALALRDCERHTVIQADQHGEAHVVPPTLPQSPCPTKTAAASIPRSSILTR